jgi:EAL domain-containing protein (putative c-di-GMP-specific phosphodiesterase class I)
VVKIDKSIVDNYLTDKNSSFIQNITRLVHGLGMKLTVEGVEYDWQVEKLNGFSCDYIQGYFYSRPISGVDVESFFKNFRG